MRIGSDVQLDHPTKSSKAKNPDVLVTIDGARWGIACIMLNPYDKGCPAKPSAYFTNIEDGVRDHGLVIISRKNVINHDRAWPLLNPEHPPAATLVQAGLSAGRLLEIEAVEIVLE